MADPDAGPEPVLDALELAAPGFERFVQQDAHEALKVLLHHMQREVLNRESPKLGNVISVERTLDPSTRLFSVAIAATRTCLRCGAVSFRVDQQTQGMEVEMRGDKGCSLHELLGQHFADDVFEMDCVRCGKTKQKKPHLQQTCLIRRPRYLVIELSR